MAARGSRLRFELGRMEVAGVVVSTAAGLFVVFLLGIYAGRGMAERHLEMDEAIVRQPVEAAPLASAEEDELTFYETLAGEARAAKRAGTAGTDPAAGTAARAEAAVPAAERPGIAASGGADEPAPAAEPKAPAGATAPAADGAAQPAEPGRGDPASPSEEKPAGTGPTEPKPRVAVALVDEPAAPPPPSARGEWSVQVLATRDPRHAERILRRLKASGFDVYVVQTRRGGETFHRVRVGHYQSLDDARAIARRVRGIPGVPEAFVASD